MIEKLHEGLTDYLSFLTQACEVYEKSAPTVYNHCNDLYVRISEQPKSVTLKELFCVSRLLEEDQWEQANYAANRIYHLRTELKMDTTGQAGF